MKTSKVIWVFLVCPAISCAILFLAGLAAAQPARTSIAQDVPISIAADNMTYDPDRHKVEFTGSVKAVRGDFNMWANVLTLYLKPSGDAAPKPDSEDGAAIIDPSLAPGDLDKIVAERNVRFQINAQSGTAAKATYTLDTGILVLEGQPTLRDGENSITGDVIRYYMNENRSEISGGPSRRVEAFFSGAAGR